MRVLMLAQDLPFPPTGGGQLRTFHLLRSLAARHELTLVGFVWGPAPPPTLPVRVIGVPWEWPPLYRQMKSDDAEASRRAFAALDDADEEPWMASCYRSDAMQEVLCALAGECFDRVVIEGAMMARFLPWLPPDAPKVLDLHDVHSRMALRAVADMSGDAREREGREAERTLRFERRVAGQCQLCLTVSEPEAAAARSLLSVDHVAVVPNGVDAAHFTPPPARATPGALLFTGLMDYAPNVEAVGWFVAEVFPRVLGAIRDARFHIVGGKPTAEVRALTSDRVVVHGFVPDTRPYYGDAELVVVPLRRGGGTRLKILEAAACGKAIVTTALGVEGLDFRPGADLVVADGPAEFAAAVVTLARDAGRRRRLGRRARRVALGYDWDRIGDRFRRLIEGLPRADPVAAAAGLE